MKSSTSSSIPATPPSVLLISAGALRDIIETIGSRPAETGGPFGRPADQDLVSHFHFDVSSEASAVTYSPDTTALNALFHDEWNPSGIRLAGFAHSHPNYYDHPSHGDCIYAHRILAAIPDLPHLWLPIILTLPDTGRFSLKPYVAQRAGAQVSITATNVIVFGATNASVLEVPTRWGVCRMPLNTVLTELCLTPQLAKAARKLNPFAPGVSAATPGNAAASITGQESVGAVTGRDNGYTAVRGPTPILDSAPAMTSNTFARVELAYDLPRMAQSGVVCIGTGGAAQWLEDLARAGLGRFVLIDHDEVSETNLATQQTYRRDLGRKKVDCIAERIHDINPAAAIVPLAVSLDSLDDSVWSQYLLPNTLLAGMTDNFPAQARVNRIALHYGVPSICAQVYREGRGAEITFTYPGVTPACHRCVLGGRYRHLLDEVPAVPLSSHGTPIFATSRLNALKGFIALAMLHHGSAHPRWGGLLARIGNRNLVQIRMDPDLGSELGLKVFDNVFAPADSTRLLFDEVVWLPQSPENPVTGFLPCADCGGLGDLSRAMGTFPDTRPMPRVYRISAAA